MLGLNSRKNKVVKVSRFLLVFILIAGWVFSGWLQIWQNPAFPPEIQQVAAAPDITLIDTTTAMGGADRITTLTVNKPTGIDNDVFIAHFSTDGDNAVDTAPIGWTLIFQTHDGKDVYSAAWYKVIPDYDAEGANYTWTFIQNESITGAIMNFRGVDTSSPINNSGSAPGDSINPTSPDINATVADTLVLRVFGCDHSNAKDNIGYPTGYTGIYSFNDSASGNGQGAAYQIQTSAGLTGAALFTLLAIDEWVAGTIALAPAAGLSTSISIRNVADNADVTNITFPIGDPDAVISNPTGNGDLQVLNATASQAAPVAILKSASAYTLWYNVTSGTGWSDAVASEKIYTQAIDGTLTLDAFNSGADNMTVWSTDQATTQSLDGANNKELFLQITLSASWGKSGDSTLTILGETP